MAKKLSINLKKNKNNRKVVMVLRGTIDGSGAYEAKNALKRLEDTTGYGMLIVDFSMIKRLERFSIAILSKAIKGCRRRFREIRLVGLESSTMNDFRRYGVDSVLNSSSFASS